MNNENNDLLEKVADFIHDQWSHWMKYIFIEGFYKDHTVIDEYLQNPIKLIITNWERWKRQMNTPYSELSEKEKDSDREWARKLIELLSKTHELRYKLNCTNCDKYAEVDHLCYTDY